MSDSDTAKTRRARERTLDVRVNDEEMRAVRDAAYRDGLPASTWARRLLLAAARASAASASGVAP